MKAMPDSPSASRRNVGPLLLLAAVVLAGWSFLAFRTNKEDAESQASVNAYVNASAGTNYDLGGDEADQTMPIIGGAVAAVLFLSGVILIAGAQRPDP